MVEDTEYEESFINTLNIRLIEVLQALQPWERAAETYWEKNKNEKKDH